MQNGNQYFISDTHFTESRPEHLDAFIKLCSKLKSGDQLVLLGDIFEVWTGDDTVGTAEVEIESFLHALVKKGVSVYFMHGNRDFLVGKDFANRVGCTILKDPCNWTLASGQKCMLTHGDIFCTHDKAYRRFRNFTRNKLVQKLFLLLPKGKRASIARSLRDASKKSQTGKTAMLLDANENLIKQFLNKYAPIKLVIMGHTHRPNIHRQAYGERVVLGDWHSSIWYGKSDEDGDFSLYENNLSVNDEQLRFSIKK